MSKNKLAELAAAFAKKPTSSRYSDNDRQRIASKLEPLLAFITKHKYSRDDKFIRTIKGSFDQWGGITAPQEEVIDRIFIAIFERVPTDQLKEYGL
jgi:hypothetical protein